jgi:hypothetical protein
VAVGDQLAPQSRRMAAGSKARHAFRANASALGANPPRDSGKDAAGFLARGVTSAAIHEGPSPMALMASRRRSRLAAAARVGQAAGRYSAAWPILSASPRALEERLPRAASPQSDYRAVNATNVSRLARSARIQDRRKAVYGQSLPFRRPCWLPKAEEWPLGARPGMRFGLMRARPEPIPFALGGRGPAVF